MIRIAVAGDFLPRHRVAALAQKGDYGSVMDETRQVCSTYDYCIVNLEGPVVTGDAAPIVKNGPCLKCGEKAIPLLRHGGFHCATLANNHFLDYGEDGARQTLDALRQHGIDFVGGGMNVKEAGATLYRDINGETLAIINCAEHEFSIATDKTAGSNPLNPIRLYYDIAEARKTANHVVVITHGGVEQYDLPTPRMKELYRFLIDAGADVVVNHHQHCPCAYEVYHGKPIFYGLGNFCFDAPSLKHQPWNKGYMVGLVLDGEKPDFSIIPYVQCDDQPTVTFADEKANRDTMSHLDELNLILADDNKLRLSHEDYMRRTSTNYLNLFTPYSSRFARALCEKGLLPAYYPRSKWPAMLNGVECESHRERLIYYIRNKMGK